MGYSFSEIKSALARRICRRLARDLKRFAVPAEIPGLVTFAPGRGDLPCVKLQHSCGSTAEVSLQMTSLTAHSDIDAEMHGISYCQWLACSTHLQRMIVSCTTGLLIRCQCGILEATNPWW